MIKRIFFLALLVFAISAQARTGILDSLGISSDFDTPPSVEEAFIFSASLADEQTIKVEWIIAEGNYLYRDKISFELINNGTTELQPFSLPAGENKMDEVFGLSEVYTHDTSILLPLKRGTASTTITLKAHYQGCSETFHICYPPTENSVDLNLLALTNSNETATTSIAPAEATQTSSPVTEQDRIAQRLAEDSLIKILLSFLGLGLLLAFTPCVFPMIPILSSIIVGEGERITTHRAFVLSLSYVLAMSLTYTAAGVMTGLLGENLQSMFQNPWIIGSFSALFVILALSMFGLFELQLPHFVQHQLHQISHRQQGGHIVGAATMGLLSGLIVGPCLAPPLAGALIFIGQHGDPVLGGLALFALSMGMGLPLLIIGTSAGRLLPKAGDWMTTIKTVFGVLMLALAIWMLERIIPAWVVLLLWGGLLVVIAIYLGALNSLTIDANGWQKLWKGVGVLLLIYGSLLIIGGASGSHNVWQPLQNLAIAANKDDRAQPHLPFKSVNNLAELNHYLTRSNKPVMLDFYADWCIECKRMETSTFKDPAVIASLSAFETLQLDMTDNNAEHKALLKQFGLFGPPTLLFFDANGKEHWQSRLIGMIESKQLLEHIASLPSHAKSL